LIRDNESIVITNIIIAIIKLYIYITKLT
jgi:hypothetical protein